jgi:serine/threonine protein kinase
MMYEMLTGKVPFRGDNWLAVMAGHLGENPVPIRRVRPDVPPQLEAVVMHAMRRQPAHRYQTADALVADLDHLDQVNPDAYDLSAEPAMGGMASINSEKRMWALVALLAVSFVGVVGIIITLSIVLR